MKRQKIVLVFALLEDVSFYIVSTLISLLRLHCFYALRFPQKQSWSRETDLLARLAQLLVKLGTEAADERLFKKLIYG